MSCVETTNTCDWTLQFPLKTVLLVYEAKDAHAALKWYLTSHGYVVDSVRSGEEAMEVFDPVIHDVVVTDNPAGGMSGEDLAQMIKLWSPKIPVVMYTDNVSASYNGAAVDAVVLRSPEPEDLKVELDRIFAEQEEE